MLNIIKTCKTAPLIMRIDAGLLDNLKEPTLHLYTFFFPSITYGCFLSPGKQLNLQNVKKNSIQLAKRPTGGGVVFHLWDLAFSFLLPSTHPLFKERTDDNYLFVNMLVCEALKQFLPEHAFEFLQENQSPALSGAESFCMARPTKYDAVINKKKFIGAAQRRKKQGYLHQGTISLAPPEKELLNELLLKKEIADIIDKTTLSLFPESGHLEEKRVRVMSALEKKFQERFFD